MRQILLLAAVVLVAGSFAARFADRELAPPRPQVAAEQPMRAAPQVQVDDSYGRTLTLNANRQGHFEVEARIDGRHIRFMVDTGASLVALRESDAGEVGIHPFPSDFTAMVATANGKIKGARAKLDRIEIGDITVYDVPALVLPDEALSQNLLGVSFLSRLKRYEYANGRMVLEQ
jgi:aspartyl protease family protein